MATMGASPFVWRHGGVSDMRTEATRGQPGSVDAEVSALVFSKKSAILWGSLDG